MEWTVGKFYLRHTIDREHCHIAEVENLADAKLIVKILNSHAALLAACKRVETTLRTRNETFWFPVDVRKQVRSAIKAGEGV